MDASAVSAPAVQVNVPDARICTCTFPPATRISRPELFPRIRAAMSFEAPEERRFGQCGRQAVQQSDIVIGEGDYLRLFLLITLFLVGRGTDFWMYLVETFFGRP